MNDRTPAVALSANRIAENKRKAKFNGGNLTSIKEDLNMLKKTSKIDETNACSIQTFSNTPCMKLCSR